MRQHRSIERLSGVLSAVAHTVRTHVDLVGVDQWPGARKVNAVGSIKWRDRSPFNQRDLADLAVSRSGCTARDLTAVYSPDDLVSAWR